MSPSVPPLLVSVIFPLLLVVLEPAMMYFSSAPLPVLMIDSNLSVPFPPMSLSQTLLPLLSYLTASASSSPPLFVSVMSPPIGDPV